MAPTRTIAEKVVLGSIFRAGLPLHEGFLSYFDYAENAFISAYRKYIDGTNEFVIRTEYLASPSIEGKVLVIADPMLATGGSMDVAIRAFLQKGTPKHIHIAVVIATDHAIEYLGKHLPDGITATVWAADIDHVLNDHSYIVPGLGDAGDLLYGEK